MSSTDFSFSSSGGFFYSMTRKSELFNRLQNALLSGMKCKVQKSQNVMFTRGLQVLRRLRQGQLVIKMLCHISTDGPINNNKWIKMQTKHFHITTTKPHWSRIFFVGVSSSRDQMCFMMDCDVLRPDIKRACHCYKGARALDVM